MIPVTTPGRLQEDLILSCEATPPSLDWHLFTYTTPTGIMSTKSNAATAVHPMDKQPGTRASTPRCEVSYDFDPKGEYSRSEPPAPKLTNPTTDHSPTFASLLKARIAIGRRQELEKVAKNEEPPDDQELTECCGSRCKPVSWTVLECPQKRELIYLLVRERALLRKG
jgi:hypothetical protein